MSDIFILILGQRPAELIRWATVSSASILQADEIPNADALHRLRSYAQASKRVAVILPGETVAMRSMASPPSSESKFRAAAQLLMEDEMAEAPEALHIATVRRSSGAGAAYGVKRSLLDEWQIAFASAGILPDVVAPDFALLPTTANEGIIVFESVRLTAAFGDAAFAAERPLADTLVETLVANGDTEKISAFGDDRRDSLDFAGKPVAWKGAADAANVFLLYAEGLAGRYAPNLLQGEYRKKTDWRASIGPWRRAAMLAVACIVGAFAMTASDAIRSARAAAKYNTQAREVHLQAFPEMANINPRDHARRVLSDGRQSPSFARITNAVAAAVTDADNVVVERIRYDAARGRYSINVRFVDITALENVKTGLARRNVTANETGGVRRSGNFYIGELEIGA